jgi:glycosyltransferase involved in cell wall biosynthesis
VDVLVDAFRQIPGPQRLTVIGLAGSLADRIRQAAAADPRIELHPAVPYARMPEVYAAHHVVCCPVHWNEPFGLTVLEGRVTRRAVIGTRQGGLPEILEGYARAHLLEPTADRVQRVQSLADALAGAAERVRRPLDLQAEAAFLRQFELSTVVDRYEERIQRSLNARSGL